MIHHQDDTVTVHHGDCIEVLATLPDNSIDAVVTDPPYGLEFMGKEWDAPWKAEGKHWRAAAPASGPTLTGRSGRGSMAGHFNGTSKPAEFHADSGGASRFMYVAKAPRSERPTVDGVSHATVKPLTLMRWLVRLVTPPGGTVLEPFAGSGTTVEAAVLEGFRCIAVEREAEYLPLIMARLARIPEPADPELTLFDGEAS